MRPRLPTAGRAVALPVSTLLAVCALPAHALEERRVELARRASEPQRLAVPLVDVVDAEQLMRRGLWDVGDAVATLMGVQVVHLSDGRRALVVEGLAARLLLCVDGRPVTRGPDGYVDLGELPTAMEEVQRMELVRQPLPGTYGTGAEAGVLNVVTRRTQTAGASVGAVVGVHQDGPASVMASGMGSNQAGRMRTYVRASGQQSLPLFGTGAGGRRAAGASVGGALRLHPRAVVRGDLDVRALDLEPLGAFSSTAWSSRRAAGRAEAVVLLREQDAVHLEVVGGLVRREGTGAGHVVEQRATLRYLGEPLSGHFITVEAGGRAEWWGPALQLTRQRLSGSLLLQDSWQFGRTFALEVGMRMEAADVAFPALGPSVAFRYEPFRHVMVRGSVSAGYRFRALNPDPAALPRNTLEADAGLGAHESSRAGRLSVVYEPDDHLRVQGEVFRTELSAAPVEFATGALTVGLALGSVAQTWTPAAHVQGGRVEFLASRLPGGAALQVGYAFLQQAVDDRKGVVLELAPRHSGAVRVGWAPPVAPGLSLNLAAELVGSRSSVTGAVVPLQSVLTMTAAQRLGPLEVVVAADNLMHERSDLMGPRFGRGARLAVRAGW